MFEISIKQAALLTPEENIQVDEVDHLAFSGPNGGLPDQNADIEWSNPDWLILGRLDGRIVSLVCVICRDVQVNQQILPVGGVGGVATHPDFQRRGLAGQMMERTAAFLRDELKLPYGLLVCSDLRVHYYQKYGWQLIQDPMVFDWRGIKRAFSENTMTLQLGSSPWPRGTVDLRGKPW